MRRERDTEGIKDPAWRREASESIVRRTVPTVGFTCVQQVRNSTGGLGPALVRIDVGRGLRTRRRRPAIANGGTGGSPEKVSSIR